MSVCVRLSMCNERVWIVISVLEYSIGITHAVRLIMAFGIKFSDADFAAFGETKCYLHCGEWDSV